VRTVEIQTLAEFDAQVARAAAAGSTSMRGWQVQDLDLTGRDDVLAALDPRGALFLGCRFRPATEGRLRDRGALLFPTVPDVPFDAYRSTLYTPEELYAGLEQGYEATPDARIYAWSRAANNAALGGTSVHDGVAMALHDTAIDDALAEQAAGDRVVGVMGGHAVERGQPAYAAAARLGQALAEDGWTVATGGGPGAMEAANLGATVAGTDTLPAALAALGRVPAFRPSVTDWARAAFAAIPAGVPRSDRSLGVPTWFYGHEPPNPFCSRIAKYFRNAIREDVLLHLCRGGIAFLPGSAGTLQEVFQAACENYYSAPEESAPMVLVGREYWTRELPAWPLLSALAAGGPLAARLTLVDRADEVPAVLGEELGGRPG
jgi:predicted Rossmann-fold nucleotide-binding protein